MFKRFFNKKRKTENKNTDSSEIPQHPTPSKAERAAFHQAVIDNIQRYLSAADTTMDLDWGVNDKQGHFAEQYPLFFEEWLKIQSSWDKRTIIYSLLDELLGSQLKLWQKIMRLVDDRFAEKALAEFQNMNQEDFETADFWAAKAKACLVLINYKEAEQSAEKALKIDPEHRVANTQLADVYQLTGRTKLASMLYRTLINSSRLALEHQGQRLHLDFQTLLGFKGNVLHSPLYAVSLLHQQSSNAEAEWEALSDEFYWSPHFRVQHAYFLLNNQQPLQGLSKLLTVTKEMPWYEEAVVNSQKLIIEMNGQDALASELSRLNALIKEKGWA